MFAQNFEATFLSTFCRQLRSLDIFYATHLTFAQNFEAAFLPTFCRQLRSLDIFDWNSWLQLLFAQIFYLSLPTYCRQLKILDVFDRNLWLQLLFAQFFCLFCLPFVGNLCFVLLCDQNRLVGPKWFWSDQIDLDMTIMIWSQPKWNGDNQNEFFRSKL